MYTVMNQNNTNGANSKRSKCY